MVLNCQTIRCTADGQHQIIAHVPHPDVGRQDIGRHLDDVDIPRRRIAVFDDVLTRAAAEEIGIVAGLAIEVIITSPTIQCVVA